MSHSWVLASAAVIAMLHPEPYHGAVVVRVSIGALTPPTIPAAGSTSKPPTYSATIAICTPEEVVLGKHTVAVAPGDVQKGDFDVADMRVQFKVSVDGTTLKA